MLGKIFLNLVFVSFSSLSLLAQDSIKVSIQCYMMDSIQYQKNKSYYPREDSRPQVKAEVEDFCYLSATYPKTMTDTLVLVNKAAYHQYFATLRFSGLQAERGQKLSSEDMHLVKLSDGIILPPISSEKTKKQEQSLTLSYGLFPFTLCSPHFSPRFLLFPKMESYLFTPKHKPLPTRIGISSSTFQKYYVVSDYKLNKGENEQYIQTMSDKLPLLALLRKEGFHQRDLSLDSVNISIYYEGIDYNAPSGVIKLKDKSSEADSLTINLKKQVQELQSLLGHRLPKTRAKAVFSDQSQETLSGSDTINYSYSFVERGKDGGANCLMFDLSEAKTATLIHELIHLLAKCPNIETEPYKQKFLEESITEYVACVLFDGAKASMKHKQEDCEETFKDNKQMKELLKTGKVFYSGDNEGSTAWIYYGLFPLRLAEYAKSQHKSQYELAKALVQSLEELASNPKASLTMQDFEQKMKAKGFKDIASIYEF